MLSVLLQLAAIVQVQFMGFVQVRDKLLENRIRVIDAFRVVDTNNSKQVSALGVCGVYESESCGCS